MARDANRHGGHGRRRGRGGSVLPGFRLSVGLTVTYLSLIVLFPLSMVFIEASTLDWKSFREVILDPRVVAAFRVSFLTAFAAAWTNVIFGLLVAWVLVRYQFPGRRLIDGLVDLPFALPTAVAGISLTTLYAENGWVGGLLKEWGVKVSFTPLGITVALVFIGLPFVVRLVQPVLEQLEVEMEEAAVMLGARRRHVVFRVIFPELLPALSVGFALAFARGIGEYGSVVFISGNMPMKTEIVPLLIMTKMEQFDYPGATAIAAVMLIVSFFLLLVINVFQWQASRRMAAD